MENIIKFKKPSVADLVAREERLRTEYEAAEARADVLHQQWYAAFEQACEADKNEKQEFYNHS